MPMMPGFPGVAVEENRNGVRTITGVATSVTAFIGSAKRGPVDRAVHVVGFADYERRFGGLSKDSEMSYAVHQFFNSGGGDAWIVRVEQSSTSAMIDLSVEGNAVSLKVLARDAGSAGNNIRIVVGYDTANLTSAFHLTAIDLDPNDPDETRSERFENLSMNSADGRFVETAINNISALITVEVTGIATAIRGEAHLIGGSERPLDIADPYASIIASRADRKGIFALENVDLFNVLCMPGITHGLTLASATAYCEERRAFFIIDPPSGQTPGQMESLIAGATLPKSSNAAVYYPRLQIGDPLRSGALRTVAPSGTIAGVFARTDATRGVWKAPAGTEATLNGVRAAEYALTDPENGVLNQLGVNCVRAFPVHGAVVWGARTLRGADAFADEWKYIPIRRLALYLQESLDRGTKWVVFEPNDEALWARIRLNASAFMQNLFLQGAFQGRSPSEAYVVKCDRETTTGNDIDHGIVNLLVGFAPLRPAEFVFLTIRQLAGQIQT